jgi:hypothetical protein
VQIGPEMGRTGSDARRHEAGDDNEDADADRDQYASGEQAEDWMRLPAERYLGHPPVDPGRAARRARGCPSAAGFITAKIKAITHMVAVPGWPMRGSRKR